MHYRSLGRTHLLVSELGFGALEIGRNWPFWRQEMSDFSRPTEADAIHLVHRAIECGINFFDTAPAYFQSEEILGQALEGQRRNVILATKCGEWFDGTNSVYNYSYEETLRFLENSLKKLRTDYIDLLQIHSAPLEVVERGETLAAMQKAKAEGKVRYIGLSTDSIDAAQKAIDCGGFDTIQVSYNLLKQQFAEALFENAERTTIGIIVKDCLAQGKLTGKQADLPYTDEKKRIERLQFIAREQGMDLAEMALRYVLSSTVVSTVIIGTRNLDHLTANIQAMKKGKLDPSTMQQIRNI